MKNEIPLNEISLLGLDKIEGKIKWWGIVIHHSASQWGNLDVINIWHKERKFPSAPISKLYCGYHFIIYNGFLTYKQYKDKVAEKDLIAKIVVARKLNEFGIHAMGFNTDKGKPCIAICLIGNFEVEPPLAQCISKTVTLTQTLIRKFNIPKENVIPHWKTFILRGEASDELSARTIKSCPGKYFEWDNFYKKI